MIKPITLFDYAGNYTEIWFIDKMKSYNSRGGKKKILVHFSLIKDSPK